MTGQLPEDMERLVRSRAEHDGLSVELMTERVLRAYREEELPYLTEHQKIFIIAAAACAVRDADVLERLA